jgi:hypothetical protein
MLRRDAEEERQNRALRLRGGALALLWELRASPRVTWFLSREDALEAAGAAAV